MFSKKKLPFETSITMVIVSLVFIGCGSIKLSNDEPPERGDYYVRLKGEPVSKAYVHFADDSIMVYPKIGAMYKPRIDFQPNMVFVSRGLDVDVLSIPFKYHPAEPGLPRQLTVDFNGNVYMGYRIDRHRVQYVDSPAGTYRKIKHTAYTIGGFAGLGTSFISPWTTNNQITDEYNGFILSRGVSAMVGYKSLTVGLGLGWDFLTDRDKDVWVYQNRPWYGLTISLNLN
jgi:hypothetical protein